MNFLQDFLDRLYINFIEDNRYMYIVEGLKNTVLITFCAVFIGIFIGMF